MLKYYFVSFIRLILELFFVLQNLQTNSLCSLNRYRFWKHSVLRQSVEEWLKWINHSIRSPDNALNAYESKNQDHRPLDESIHMWVAKLNICWKHTQTLLATNSAFIGIWLGFICKNSINEAYANLCVQPIDRISVCIHVLCKGSKYNTVFPQKSNFHHLT